MSVLRDKNRTMSMDQVWYDGSEYGAWDRTLMMSNLVSVGDIVMTRVTEALEEVARSGLLEAAGLRDNHVQYVCNRLYREVHTTVQNTLEGAYVHYC